MDGVAASLREEDRNVVLLDSSIELVVAGNGVGGIATPFIGIQSEEVHAIGRVGLTGEVVLEHRTEGCDISSGITDGDLAVALLVTVCLHIASGSKNVGRSNRVIDSGENFVADKETDGIVVLLEFVHGSLKSTSHGLGPGRFLAVDSSLKVIEIDEQVDTSISKDLHTVGMVRGLVDVVDANGVGTQLSHQRSIKLALCRVEERIVFAQLVSNT